MIPEQLLENPQPETQSRDLEWEPIKGPYRLSSGTTPGGKAYHIHTLSELSYCSRSTHPRDVDAPDKTYQSEAREGGSSFQWPG